MGSLKENAKEYEPQQTKNIAELEVVPVDSEVLEREFKDKDGNGFKISVIVVDGEDYRVPVSVLKSLKAILEEKPEVKAIKVLKSGEGLKTEYTVIPL
jgi:dynactin complex subunit|tara:strand:- start:2998 stop:3291 length:294 start_codon:yes stop_codon:yes gene_type:complete